MRETKVVHSYDVRVGSVTSQLRFDDSGTQPSVVDVGATMDTPVDQFVPSRRRRLDARFLIVIGVVLALLAAACGDDADDSGSADDSATETASGDGDSGGFDDFTTDSGDDFFGEEDSDPDRLDGNEFEDYGIRPFVDADVDNRSTFALDVDTGAYTITRRWLDEGVMPDPASVRVEEFVNAFDYGYQSPSEGLSLYVDGAPSPFDSGNVLVRIGVQGQQIDRADAVR